jgi:aminoglycoside 3-N-acetyltransferase
LVAAFYDGVRSVIGSSGTLVVPTFTQQVGRFGVAYVHEETESLTGIFGEYVRSIPGALRSLHPVFSVSAIGPRAEAITHDVSPVAFGRDSSFDRLYRMGGKSVCAGFEYYSGHITTLMHYVETIFAVPYYYNKYVLAEVWAGGKRVDRPFVINVKYFGANCEFDFRRYIDSLAAANAIESATLGAGMVYSVDIRQTIDAGWELLKSDMYAFLNRAPSFEAGAPPLDGPPERVGTASVPRNLSGCLIGI